jgi:hypothetical protein
MFTRLSRRAFPYAALSVAALLTACSQSNAGSALPTTATQQASHPAVSTHIAAQAKAMLALVHGRNHAVIGTPVGIAKLFEPVRPNAAEALYDSILANKNGKTSSDIASEGFECCSVDEFGDGMNLTENNARPTQVSVILDSWACESGFWNSECTTTPGTTFSEPITLKIYSVTTDQTGNPAPGAVLVQDTQTFNIPFRPSSDPRCQGPNAGKFVGKVDKECDNGLADKIVFNVKVPKTSLPQQVIATVAYDTSDSGYQPYGQGTQCFTGPGGCGYDALNVSAWGDGGFDGSPLDPNGVFVYYTYPGFYCNGTGNGTQGLQLDTPCWTGYHPEIKIGGTGGSAS